MKETNFKVEYLNKEILALASNCDHKTLAIWALDCSERVLPYFEDKYPEDNRPRLAIEAGRAWVRDELPMWEARKFAIPAHASARDVVSDLAACAAARSSGQALGAAHVAGHAPHAATYAAKAVGYAKEDINKEREWQYSHLLELYQNQKI